MNASILLLYFILLLLIFFISYDCTCNRSLTTSTGTNNKQHIPSAIIPLLKYIANDDPFNGELISDNFRLIISYDVKYIHTPGTPPTITAPRPFDDDDDDDDVVWWYDDVVVWWWW